MKNYLNLLLLFYFLPFTLLAKIQLPNILSDNMVLQQKTDIKLWGYAKPNTMVVVKASWSKRDYKIRSDKNGKWLLLIPTPEAGGPYEISISDGEELKLNNVLVGEVWFCSGQSNMEMPMKGFSGQPVEGANDIILKSKKSLPIRMFTSANEFSQTPREDINGYWLENTPESVAECSATAYYFAKCIQDVLEVPVGLVISAWGGTYIESWMSPNQLNSIAEYRNSDKEKEIFSKMQDHNLPGSLYHTKILPLSNYVVKGFIWYQGENNIVNPEVYEKLFPAFMKDIRRTWGLGDIPFYYVQIAPFRYSVSDSTESAKIREIQFKALKENPNVGMAVAMDIGDELCIHPAKKKQVGDRLAYWALSQTYGIEGFGYRAPEYKSMEERNGRVNITLDYYSSGGLGPVASSSSVPSYLDNFEIAGEDRIFYPAKAYANRMNQKIVVSSERVSNPIAVRYGYKNFVKGNIFDDSGLPISSFRTDDW